MDASRYPFYYFSAFLVFSSLFFCSLFWLLAARLIGARFVSPKFKSISIFRAATSYLLSAICARVSGNRGGSSLSLRCLAVSRRGRYLGFSMGLSCFEFVFERSFWFWF